MARSHAEAATMQAELRQLGVDDTVFVVTVDETNKAVDERRIGGTRGPAGEEAHDAGVDQHLWMQPRDSPAPVDGGGTQRTPTKRPLSAARVPTKVRPRTEEEPPTVTSLAAEEPNGPGEGAVVLNAKTCPVRPAEVDSTGGGVERKKPAMSGVATVTAAADPAAAVDAPAQVPMKKKKKRGGRTTRRERHKRKRQAEKGDE